MSGFGEKMRREREMRGVSLEEISESTKIGTRSLRALEEEDFEKLPGGIFNKGFVRAYSRFIGLDEDQAVADFEAAWREHQAANGLLPEVLSQVEQETPEPSSNRLLAIVALVLLAVATGGYAIKYFWGTRTANTNLAPTPVVQEAPPPQSSAEGQSPPTPSSSVSEPVGISKEKAAPVPSASSKSPAEAPKNTPSPFATSKAGAAELASSSGTYSSSAAILLEAIAREDSWLSVSADGKSLGQGILSAQKSRTIRANKEVRLRVGNVAGVEVSFNGKPVNIDGEPKQVKELTFTPEGLHQ